MRTGDASGGEPLDRDDPDAAAVVHSPATIPARGSPVAFADRVTQLLLSRECQQGGVWPLGGDARRPRATDPLVGDDAPRPRTSDPVRMAPEAAAAAQSARFGSRIPRLAAPSEADDIASRQHASAGEARAAVAPQRGDRA